MKHSHRKYFLFFVIMTFLTVPSLKAQDAQEDSAALAAADTTHFSINHSNNWHLFNSYVAPYQSDSAQLELIIMHANTLAWEQEQYRKDTSDEFGPFEYANDPFLSYHGSIHASN